MLSFLIPTRNRAESLRITIESLLSIPDFDDEIVVVDNNSSDSTSKVVDSFGSPVKYIKEPRLAFSKARDAAANGASGEILVFMDDDVTIRQGTADEVRRIMKANPDCGIIAGRIDPHFESPPPDWVLGCQHEFNGWSLFNPSNTSYLGFGIQKVASASGPLMAIRKSLYISVGGFPPDTVGVETDDSSVSFRKLYVGPGDYGLCHKVSESGNSILYSPKVSCLHRTPKERFSIAFWRSRMIGEAMHVAITRRKFFNFSKFRLWKECQRSKKEYTRVTNSLLSIFNDRPHGICKDSEYCMHPDELFFHYHANYLKMDHILRKNPKLDSILWELASDGVDPKIASTSEIQLPEELVGMLSDESMYDDEPIRSIHDIENRVKVHDLL